MNESSITVTLTYITYKEMGSAKNVFFIIVFTIYIASIIASVAIMLLIYLDKALHKPMYIFLFSLIVNGVIGSSAVWPKVMNILITDDNTGSYAGCLMQGFITSVYGGCNYTMLTVMAYDRFVFIFKPLQYYAIMTPHMVMKLVLIGNLIPVIAGVAQMYLTLRLSLCSIFGVCATFCLGILPVFLIILSYLKIISIILTMSAEARRKTFATCSPHLIIFIIQ
ncbi:olfactory receptor 10A6-like [Alosa pseudoharengus]|uniref:olfactory receptor 10A6-like n=1 Tax=Alosa pseudoharengus TaxID=34774 RepID=UPI003F8A019D